jgi:hypothetical protein
MAADDWRAELAAQRKMFETTESTQQAAWAVMLDATSTAELAEHLIKKLTRPQLRAIVSEWITMQDFADAMNGVEERHDDEGGDNAG